MGEVIVSPEPIHLAYLIFSGFLIIYALFSLFFRNRLHLSEPPLALLFGVIFGPYAVKWLSPAKWVDLDEMNVEFSRTVLSIQCFVVGLELPVRYLTKNWGSLLMLLGPVMTFGWIICALFVWLIFKPSIPAALLISACMTPTDPILAASILQNSKFSSRVPRRIKDLLSAESGCNDGISVPFLWVGIWILAKTSLGEAFKKWALITILWQCVFGIFVGGVIGYTANAVLRFSDNRRLIGPSSFVAFYLLLAMLALGVGSTLNLDDFLVTFSCGAAFAHDGWFLKRTQESKLNNIIDLILNSSFFIFFGSVIPWDQFVPRRITPDITPARLILLLVLVLLFRRIPVVMLLHRFTPAIRTWREALFCGHFGPMGVGALFLAAEAREKLRSHTESYRPASEREMPVRSFEMVYPIVTFVVLGSTIVHGLSVAAMSIWIHFRLSRHNRARFPGSEAEPLAGMVHEDVEEEEEEEEESSEEEDEGPWRGRVRLSGDD